MMKKIIMTRVKAKKVYENINFERGMEPKEALGLGQVKIKKIKDAISSLASEYNKKPELYNKDPKNFSMGFEYKDQVFFIELNPTYEGEFVAGVQDQNIASDDREGVNTIEEAISWLENRIEYTEENWDPSGECPTCGEWLDDKEDDCPYCED